MTTTQQLITIAIMAFATAATRFVPFLIFHKDNTPKYIQYLSTVLPPAVFGMLVIYCLKDVQWSEGSYGIPELLCIAITAVLHAWKRNMMISISGGTICYMLLIQTIW